MLTSGYVAEAWRPRPGPLRPRPGPWRLRPGPWRLRPGPSRPGPLRPGPSRPRPGPLRPSPEQWTVEAESRPTRSRTSSTNIDNYFLELLWNDCRCLYSLLTRVHTTALICFVGWHEGIQPVKTSCSNQPKGICTMGMV